MRTAFASAPASDAASEAARPADWPDPPVLTRVAMCFTRALPPLRGSGRLALALRRCYRGPEFCRFTVWPGVRMVLNPRDYLGGILVFVPHLYDRWERSALVSILRPGDTFVDIGGNIGAYALWAARLVGPSGRVFAVEADEQNYRMLLDNIQASGFQDRVTALNRGVSDRRESLCIYRNETGNCGGHNFLGRGVPGPVVECVPLGEALEAAPVTSIRLMKLDIEGFEFRVLEEYFSGSPRVRPDFLLVEIDGGPAAPGDRVLLRKLMASAGYTVSADGSNTLFRRNDAAA